MWFVKIFEAFGSRLPDYWWSHILDFDSLNIRFLAGRNKLFSSFHDFLWTPFCILTATNEILAGSWYSRAQGYLDSVERPLCILSPENAIPAEWIITRPKSNRLPVSRYSAFWRTENVISHGSQNHRLKVISHSFCPLSTFCGTENAIPQGLWDPWLKSTWVPASNISASWQPQKCFLTCHTILHSREFGTGERIFGISVSWKCVSCRFMKLNSRIHDSLW
jgi:hypothetical protein